MTVKLRPNKAHGGIYLLAIGCGLLLFLLSLLPSKQLWAATGTIDPNDNGTIGSNWVATPSGTHFAAIDDAVRQPVIPNIADHISISNNRSDTAFFQMGSVSDVSVVTSITVWAYHNDGTNGTVHAALYDNAETNMYGTEQSFASRAVDGWDSVTFNGLAMNQSNLDGLRIRFRVTKGPGSTSTVRIYAMYAVVSYTSGTLSADVVDASGNSVSSPSTSLSSVDARIDCQSSTGTLGSDAERIRVTNTTINGNWTLTIAATNGPTAAWSNGTNRYDFNDSGGMPAGCADGGDTDTLPGRLTINPSTGTITQQTLCSTAGISKGAAAGFSEGVTNTITLLSASGSQAACYYELTGVSLSQQIPGEVPASPSPYSISMTLTVTAN